MSFADVLPHPARVVDVAVESEDTRTFVLAPLPPVPALDAARPGQFVMLSLPGHGEAAFTPAALPGGGGRPGTVVLTVRRVGRLTGALFACESGTMVGLRGPYGRGFPEEASRPTVYVGGGCGLSPLKAAIEGQIVARPAGTPIAVVYGARTPEARIHRSALAAWTRTPDVAVLECVERPDDGWRGRIGTVVDLVEDAVRRIGADRAAVCGPAAMLRPVAERLCAAGIRPGDVHLSIERYMACATGYCGHCYVGDRYVCRDGPVFSFEELRPLADAFPPIADASS
jgi:NAD(P)H-flavin reductase